jgi:hypothetical protein
MDKALSVFALLSALILTPTVRAADESDTALIHPERVRQCLRSPQASAVEVHTDINPYYLRGDFDGDGKADYAVAVAGLKTRRGGVLVCAGNGRAFVLGADQPLNPPFSDMPGDNFFAPNWEVFSRQETRSLEQWGGISAAMPPRKIRGESIAMIWEDGVAIIYWDGQAFKWAAPRD